jgi:hypothetical protein
MSEPSAPERALARIGGALVTRRRSFALVGGLAVSLRAEVRFTRDVDVAVTVKDDADAEALVRDLVSDGFRTIATVEHDILKRLSTARLRSPEGVVVDLLFASSGIEAEIAARASSVEVPHVGSLPVARSEELLAMKVLSMRESRLQDRIDASHLLETDIDLESVRENLELIEKRGYHRNQDLRAKLEELLRRTTGQDES